MTDAGTSAISPAIDAASAGEDAPPVALSLVICTYNRCQSLRVTLSSFGAVVQPAGHRIELLIVDNRSTDATPAVCADFVRNHPYARYTRENTQGLSHARNRGVHEARGRIIAFADDDVDFDPGWVTALLRCFHDHPDANAVGGKSIPVFEGGPPAWMCEDFLEFYGDTRCGNLPKWMHYPSHPFGLNMAFRREVFDRVGGFDPNLGRIRQSLLSGEESELFERIHAHGLRTLYTPEAVLFHRIPRERATPSWILSRSYWQGVSDALRQARSTRIGRAQLLASALGGLAARSQSCMAGSSHPAVPTGTTARCL